MPDPALVHVIDDDDAFRDSLMFLFTAASIKADSYASADAFLQEMPKLLDGCIVTDVRMPGMSGIDLLKHLQESGKSLPVIVMTGHGDVPLAVEAMRAGAFDFIEKPFDDEVLIASVRSALEHRRANRRQDEERAEIRARLATLTGRERDVLDGLIVGHPNKTIAYDLGISPRTVEIYRANVMSKLQASSLSELVRIAFIAHGSADLASE